VPKAVVGKTVFHLPPEVSYEEGALVESFSVGLHAALMAAPDPTEVAVVIGLGAIGQSVVQSIKAMGIAKVIGVDICKLRLEKAENLGADVIIDASSTDPLEKVTELLGEGAYGVGSRADMVFECSGAALMLQEAVQMVRAGGKLFVTALFEGNVPIDATMIVQKELKVQGTFGYLGEFPKSIELMRTKRVNVEPLVTHRFPLDRIQEAFELPGSQSLKVLITP
jgi:L-iditol 2-dehydrogenase